MQHDRDALIKGLIKQMLAKALSRVKKGLLSLHLKAKEVREKSQEEDDKFAVLFLFFLSSFLLLFSYDHDDRYKISTSILLPGR